MNKSFFRPLWSYDVQKTEIWLTELEWQGWLLVSVDSYLRIFRFVNGEPKRATFIFHFGNLANDTVPTGLTNEGWKAVCASTRWRLLENTNPRANINTYPSRDGILKRNRIVSYIINILFIIALIPFVLAIIPLIFIGIGLELKGWNLLVLILAVLPFGFTVYLKAKLRNSIDSLSKEVDPDYNSIPYNGYKANYDIKTGKKLYDDFDKTKVRVAWIYSPDKTEQWLAKMSAQGFHLSDMSSGGNSFHFRKGECKKIKYCLDYQNYADEEYFNIHKQSGWRQIEISNQRLMKWTIWAKDYSGDAEPTI